MKTIVYKNKRYRFIVLGNGGYCNRCCFVDKCVFCKKLMRLVTSFCDGAYNKGNYGYFKEDITYIKLKKLLSRVG